MKRCPNCKTELNEETVNEFNTISSYICKIELDSNGEVTDGSIIDGYTNSKDNKYYHDCGVEFDEFEEVE